MVNTTCFLLIEILANILINDYVQILLIDGCLHKQLLPNFDAKINPQPQNVYRFHICLLLFVLVPMMLKAALSYKLKRKKKRIEKTINGILTSKTILSE